jgi:hypothetical protein
LQSGRVAGDHVLVRRVGDQFDRLRGVCGQGPEALGLRQLRGWKRQDIAARIASVERSAGAILERVVVRCRTDVVAELDELGDGGAVEDVVAPIPDIGEMDPVVRAEVRGVIVDDRGVGGLSGGSEVGVLPEVPIAEKDVELVRQPLLISRFGRRVGGG